MKCMKYNEYFPNCTTLTAVVVVCPATAIYLEASLVPRLSGRGRGKRKEGLINNLRAWGRGYLEA